MDFSSPSLQYQIWRFLNKNMDKTQFHSKDFPKGWARNCQLSRSNSMTKTRKKMLNSLGNCCFLLQICHRIMPRGNRRSICRCWLGRAAIRISFASDPLDQLLSFDGISSLEMPHSSPPPSEFKARSFGHRVSAILLTKLLSSSRNAWMSSGDTSLHISGISSAHLKAQ